jgi:hypothetical protein
VASGGYRHGAGRKLGSVNAMSMRAREEASNAGELPHEFLLRVSRGETIGVHEPTFSERVDAAKAAAPYFSPRFSAATLDASFTDNSASNPGEMTDEELLAIIRNDVKDVREMTSDELEVKIAALNLQIDEAKRQAELSE